MLILLATDNLISIESALQKITAKVKAPQIELFASKTSINEFLDACRSFGIFGNAPYVVLRMDALNKYQEFYDVLDKVHPETTLVIITPIVESYKLKNIFRGNPKKFKIQVPEMAKNPEANVFVFVDSLFDLNRTASYKNYEQLTNLQTDPFYLFIMILFGLRNVFNAKFNSLAHGSAKPFVQTKSSKQAKNFEESQIVQLFEYFYELDKKTKTGELHSDLLNILAIEKILSYTKK